MTPNTLPEWANKVSTAIDLAVAKDRDAAHATLGSILYHHGPQVAPELVTVLVDLFLAEVKATHRDLAERRARIGGPTAIEASVIPRFYLDGEDQPIDDTDQIQPEVVWAGRMISARAALDADQWTALYYAQAQTGRLGTGISVLLSVVAAGIRAHRQGAPIITDRITSDPEIPDTPEGLA